jgi:hypothetical protein
VSATNASAAAARFLHALDADSLWVFGRAVGDGGSLVAIGSWDGLRAAVAGLATCGSAGVSSARRHSGKVQERGMWITGHTKLLMTPMSVAAPALSAAATSSSLSKFPLPFASNCATAAA